MGQEMMVAFISSSYILTDDIFKRTVMIKGKFQQSSMYILCMRWYSQVTKYVSFANLNAFNDFKKESDYLYL